MHSWAWLLCSPAQGGGVCRTEGVMATAVGSDDRNPTASDSRAVGRADEAGGVHPRRTGEHRDRRECQSGDGHRTEERVVRRRSMGEAQARDDGQSFEAARRRIEQHDDEAQGAAVLLCDQVRKGGWPAPVTRLDDTVPDGLAVDPPPVGSAQPTRCCACSRQEQDKKQTKDAARPTAITMKAARFRRVSAGAKGVGTTSPSEIRASRRPAPGRSAETGSLRVMACPPECDTSERRRMFTAYICNSAPFAPRRQGP